MGQARLATFSVTLTANQRKPGFALQGDFFHIVSATGAFNLYLDGSAFASLTQGFGYKAPPGAQFRTFDFEDTSGAGNTIVIAYGEGELRDSRLSLVSTPTFTLSAASISAEAAAILAALQAPLTRGTVIGDAADVTLNNGSETALLAADSTRRRALIVADPANTVNLRIGKTGQVGAARGVLLQPGQSITVETTAGIYGYAAAASQKVSIMTEHD